MTCIVGIKTENNVYMGGDTLGSNSFTGQSYVRPKVFKKNNFLFGVCGSYRVMQLLEFDYNPPRRLIGQNIDEYLYLNIPDTIRQCLKTGGAVTTKDGIDSLYGEFLFAHENRLFTFRSDFAILEATVNYATTGSGCYHAEASLYSTDGIITDPKERIKKAIICASNYVLSVNDKINIISLNEELTTATKNKKKK